MRSVDIHTHVLPRELPAFSPVRLEQVDAVRARMLRNDGTLFREVGHACWDAEERLRYCDAHGVGLQVLSTVPVLFSYGEAPRRARDLARFLNDHLAGLCARFPRRFAGLGTLPLQDPQLAVAELDRCVRELKLAGVQIGSHVGPWNLSEPALFPVFARAAELGAAVFVHPWDMMGEERMQKYWLPWLVGMPAEGALAICSVIFGGVLSRLPSLRIAFAHGGGAFPGTLGRIEHGFHARPDLVAVDSDRPPSHYLKRIYVDSLVHSPASLRLLLEVFGEERIALGSDYPFPLGEDPPGALLRSLSLPEKTVARISRGTALEFLGLPAGSHDDL